MNNGFRFSPAALVGIVVVCAIIAGVSGGVTAVLAGVPVDFNLTGGSAFDYCVKNAFTGGAVWGTLIYLMGTTYAAVAERNRPDTGRVIRALGVFSLLMIAGDMGSGVIMALLTIRNGGSHWMNWF